MQFTANTVIPRLQWYLTQKKKASYFLDPDTILAPFSKYAAINLTISTQKLPSSESSFFFSKSEPVTSVKVQVT